MGDFDLNSSSKYEIVKRVKINPALADDIIKARAAKPFASPADFDKRMAKVIPEALRRKIVMEMEKSAGEGQLASARQRFIQAVDRYAELVLALPRTAQGEKALPTAMAGLKLTARRLTADSPALDAELAAAAEKLMDGLDFHLEALEEATHRALAGALSGESGYRRILALSPSHPAWSSVLLSDDPAWELLMLDLTGPAVFEIGDQATGDAKSIIRRLLELGAKNKKLIAAMLKLLSKTLAPGWVEYIARLLETANDVEMFDPKKVAKGDKGGATEDCYASVYLTGVRTTGGDIGDEWTLSFKVDGEEVSHQLDFDRDYDAAPLLLRARYRIGICGQRNPVKVMFWATERESIGTNDTTRPGDVAFESFDELCPSSQEKELMTLVYEDDSTTTSEELHAKIVVFKECGEDEIGAADAM